VVAQSYEYVGIVSEQTNHGKTSYWIKVWGNGLVLDVPVDLEQIVEVIDEVPDSVCHAEGFTRRDFFAVCHLGAEQWVSIVEYEEEESGDPWMPGDEGLIPWEDDAEYDVELLGADEDEDGDTFLEPEDWEPGDDLDEGEWAEGDAEDFLGEGEDDGLE
jgi:hypothetical protein